MDNVSQKEVSSSSVHIEDKLLNYSSLFETIACDDLEILQKMINAGIKFTPDQFLKLFCNSRQSGRSMLIILQHIKWALKKCQIGETYKLTVWDHHDSMKSTVLLTKKFLEEIQKLNCFEIVKIIQNEVTIKRIA